MLFFFQRNQITHTKFMNKFKIQITCRFIFVFNACIDLSRFSFFILLKFQNCFNFTPSFIVQYTYILYFELDDKYSDQPICFIYDSI